MTRYAHTVTDAMLRDAVNAYVQCYGRTPNREQTEKLRGILHVNGNMRCFDCGARLAGGASTELDHRHADGGAIRAGGKRSRVEIAEILAAVKRGDQVDVSGYAFLCCTCNAMKANLPLNEWLVSPMLQWRKANS